MGKKIRVLHIVPKLDIGGIDSMLYNYFLEIKKYDIEWDFIVHGMEEGNVEKKLKALNCNVYHLPPKKDNFYRYLITLKKIIKKGNYDIVHAHQNNLCFIPLLVAKFCGIKIRIAHSHTCLGFKRSLKDKIFIQLNKRIASDFAYCGIQAGKWAFGDKINGKWIKNGLKIDKYKYSDDARKFLREKYSIKEDEIILGMVCRLSDEKNIFFSLKILKELVSINKHYKLFIIGDGELYNNLIEFTNKLKLNENVFFLGRRNDVEKFYSFFDIFLLPSFFEGFPVSLIEAQCSNLYSLVSNTISDEAFINKNVISIDIRETSIKEWVNYILSYKKEKRIYNNQLDQFNIANLSNDLFYYYMTLIEKYM